MQRCGWTSSYTDPLMLSYHDNEWGVPVHDDRTLYEFLVLSGVQAGLSWMTVLRKREAFREAFDEFEPAKVARYDEEKVRELLSNGGIVRNRQKIAAAIGNAKACLEVQREHGSFAAYAWSFVGGRPKINAWHTLEELPAVTQESEEMSRDMKRRGFRFVGPTICYAFMQSVGMVNDHTVKCFRHWELAPEC